MAVNWKILSVPVLAVGLVLLLVVCLLYTLTGGKIPFDHGVIIDAGSSHSEVLLYRWEGNKYWGTGKVNQIDSCEVKSGISSYGDPRIAGESLLPCLKTVAKHVEEEKRPDVPVYLAATAGMRLLNITNKYQSLAIFTAIQCSIPKSGMKVMDVGIISGQDEGTFAWITTNFLLGHLQKKGHSTVGAADMGGASTQISFEVEGPQSNNTNVVSLKLYGETYHVYSVSYLCYGSLEVYRRFLAMLVQDQNLKDGLRVNNPCGHDGQETVWDANWLLNQPCTKSKKNAEWAFLNPDKLSWKFTFVGTSNFEECSRKVQLLFDPDECRKSFSECFTPVDPFLRPKKFMTFSSYYYTMEFMKALNKSLADYTNNVRGFCAKKWKDVEEENKNEIAAVRSVVPRYCFQGVMVRAILIEGYQFNETTWSDIAFTRKVNGVSVGWALGYMTNATNAIPEEDPTLPVISTVAFAVLLVVCLLLLALGGYLCTRTYSKNKLFTSSLP